MNAIFFTEHGSADVLRYGEQPTPAPAAGELLVRVHASSVNPVDWKIRQGGMKLLTAFQLPLIPGCDVAGTVAHVGEGVEQFHPGARVFGLVNPLGGGANAEYVVLPAKFAATIPQNLSFEQAAAVPLAGLTALQALRDKGELTEGERVLINGAAGGVGTLAVQLARRLGARHVTATASAANRQMVCDLGANEVLDYQQQDFTRLAEQYDVIFDAVGESSYLASRGALRPGGRYVSTTLDPKDAALGFLASAFSDKKLKTLLTSDNGADLHQLREWLAAGQLRPVIDRAFSLVDTAEAHRYSEQGHAVGKIVLTVG